jgi:hypothetical protein
MLTLYQKTSLQADNSSLLHSLLSVSSRQSAGTSPSDTGIDGEKDYISRFEEEYPDAASRATANPFEQDNYGQALIRNLPSHLRDDGTCAREMYAMAKIPEASLADLCTRVDALRRKSGKTDAPIALPGASQVSTLTTSEAPVLVPDA